MKIFILILWLNGSGKAISMQEFNSLKSCEEAGIAFANRFSGWTGEPGYLCREK